MKTGKEAQIGKPAEGGKHAGATNTYGGHPVRGVLSELSSLLRVDKLSEQAVRNLEVVCTRTPTAEAHLMQLREALQPSESSQAQATDPDAVVWPSTMAPSAMTPEPDVNGTRDAIAQMTVLIDRHIERLLDDDAAGLTKLDQQT